MKLAVSLFSNEEGKIELLFFFFLETIVWPDDSPALMTRIETVVSDLAEIRNRKD